MKSVTFEGFLRINNKKGLAYGVLMLGISLLLFVAAVVVANNKVNVAIDNALSNAGLKLYSLVYSSESSLEYKKLLVMHSVENNRYFDNIVIYNTNLISDYINSTKRDIDGIFETRYQYQFNQPNIITNIDVINGNVRLTQYSNDYLGFSYPEEKITLRYPKYCDFDLDSRFKKYSSCNWLKDKLIELGIENKFDLLILLAISYVDTKCNKKLPFKFVLDFSSEQPIYITALDPARILDILHRKELNDFLDNLIFNLYVYHRGGRSFIERELEKKTLAEAMAEHCYTYYSMHWRKYFESLPENVKLAYKYKQEEYFCRAPNFGLNYPGAVINTFISMCDDLQGNLVFDKIRKNIVPSRYYTQYRFIYLFYDPYLAYIQSSTLNSCLNNSCFFDFTKKTLKEINNKIASLANSKSKLKLNSFSEDRDFYSLMQQYSYLLWCIDLADKLKMISQDKNSFFSYDNPSQCVCVNLKNSKIVDNNLIFKDKFSLPLLEFSFFDQNFNLVSVYEPNYYIVLNPDGELIAKDSVLGIPSCLEQYNYRDLVFYSSIKEEFSDKPFLRFVLPTKQLLKESKNMITQQYSQVSMLGESSYSISRPNPGESFSLDFDTSQYGNKYDYYFLTVSYFDPISKDVKYKNFFFFSKDKLHRFIFNYTTAKKYDMPFVNGTLFTFVFYGSTFFDITHALKGFNVEFIDNLAFDYPSLVMPNKRYSSYEHIYVGSTDNRGNLTISFLAPKTLFGGKKFTKQYFEDQFGYYLIGYANCDSLKDPLNIGLYNKVKILDKDKLEYTLTSLKPNTKYCIFVLLADKAGNLPKLS